MLDARLPLDNVAQGKTATQSSRFRWSIGQTPQEDASIAVTGTLTPDRFCHTDSEAAPWWQVDLAAEYAVGEIRIFNRREQANRLRRFSVLVSLTGQPDSWLEVHRKANDTVFGQGNDVPYVIALPRPLAARFVRVRLDEPGYLHFRRCEVIGQHQSGPGFEQLRQATQTAQRDAAAARRDIETALARGRTGRIAKVGGHDVFIDTARYSPRLVQALLSGDYEGRERRVIKTALRPGDRVLEAGTAVGAVTMTIAAIVGADHVVSYDANPAMIEDARSNFAANGLSGIAAHVGVLRNRRHWRAEEQTVEFFIAEDFWASRLDATPTAPGITGSVAVPLVCLEDAIARHRATVLICDIEGGEVDLFDGADLGAIRLIVAEAHYGITGRKAADGMVRSLQAAGFELNLDLSGSQVVVLDRA